MAQVPNVSSEILEGIIPVSSARGNGSGSSGFESALREARGSAPPEKDSSGKPADTGARAAKGTSSEDANPEGAETKASGGAEGETSSESPEGAGPAKNENGTGRTDPRAKDAPEGEGTGGGTPQNVPATLQAFVALVSGGHAEPGGRGKGPDASSHPLVTGEAGKGAPSGQAEAEPAGAAAGAAPAAADPARQNAQGVPFLAPAADGDEGQTLKVSGPATADAAKTLLAGGGLPAAAAEGDAPPAPAGPAVADAAEELLAGAKLPQEGAAPGPEGAEEGEEAPAAPARVRGDEDGEKDPAQANPGLKALAESEGEDADGPGLGERIRELASQRGVQAAPNANPNAEATGRGGDFGRAFGAADGEPGLAPGQEADLVANKSGSSGTSGGAAAGEGASAQGEGKPAGETTLSSVERFDAFLRIQVQRQIVEGALARMRLAVRDGVAHARLRLEPPALGRVDMELRVENGNLHAKVTVENAWVRDTVTANLRSLRDALQEQGVNVDQFTVDVNANLNAGGSGHDAAGSEADGPLYLEALPDGDAPEAARAGDAIAAAAGGLEPDGSVNIFA